MKFLSKQSFKRAETFIRDRGRPLEQRLLDLHFGSGSSNSVIDSLKDYQNSDGGFGKGLEPDIQMAGSSVRTTTVGLQVLREIDAPTDHAVVRSAIRYLLDTFDATSQVWQIVPAEVDDAPHAPWWGYAGRKEAFREFHLNPTAEVLGCLYAFLDDVQADLVAQLTAVVLERVEASPDAMEMHDLQCCIRLTDTTALPVEAKSRLLKKLSAVAEVEVTRNPKNWGNYTLTPISVVFGPKSCLAAQFEADIAANLDYEIDQQGEDGTWSPPWSWGDLYAEAWPDARLAWQSHLTITMLKTLRGFGRIE